MDFHSRETPIDELLTGVDAGQLALPEFQREFIWSPSNVLELLRSIARRWPTGTFLLLEGHGGQFATRPIDGAPPPAKRPRILVLDGQQRITALYHALRPVAEEVYFLDVQKLVGEEPDEAFRFTKRSSFDAQYPNTKALATALILPFSVMYDDDSFYDWLKHVAEPFQSQVRRARDRDFAGLRRHVYRMPCIYLSPGIELAALAKIFETLNRTTERLDTFDLMTASVYSEGLNLRKEWSDATDEYPLLDRFSVDPLEILKLIVLADGLLGDGRPGVRQSDVLRLSPKIVRARWSRCVQAYADALRIASQRFGAISAGLLPSRAMVLPLATATISDPLASDSAAIERWWWRSVFRQSYAQGANTQVVVDARALVTLEPRSVGGVEVTPDVMLDSRRRNEMLTRGICCMLTTDGALTQEGIPVHQSPTGATTEPTRIFPVDSEPQLDVVANYMVATRNGPRRRRDYGAREDLLAAGSRGSTIAESQMISWRALRLDSASQLLKERAKLLAQQAEAKMQRG
ncbi:GmrSD restriction endonuclease domain-containing protein [Sandaracinus amylolyticus]|uniref:GmrSD restriction endonuclease domain-containing protein n=1 Tax=Sandaracinus amylolyticus TaxID=927083 RepID=UPI00069D2682|nr:DUF262 domain-containing protein [Sandaracinus amylolyticus]